MQMFSAIRRRLTYTNVAMTLALVFAMSGGAYAASKVLITSTKQISPKVLKSLTGKTGKTGATGAQGPAGLAGATGDQGPAGSAGKEGPQGKEGPAGPAGAKGENGTTGFTETLPKGKTLKGDWSLAQYVSGEALVNASASFGIPLSQAPVPVYFKVGEEASAGSGCTGNAEDPGAEEGHLCVFASEEANIEPEFAKQTVPRICALNYILHAPFEHCLSTEGSADPYGFGVLAIAKEAGRAAIAGTWAVTAGE